MPLLARISSTLGAVLLAFAVAFSVPANASSRDAAFDDLVAAISESIDEEAAFETTLALVRQTYAQDPEFAAAERESPGFIDDVMTEIRPVLLKRSDRLSVIMDDRLADLFARHMTTAEAVELANFFRTDAVQTFNQNVSRAYSPDSQFSNFDSDAEITSGQVRQDAQNAVGAALESSSAEDLDTIEREGANLAGMKILGRIRPQAAQIRADIENAPVTPEEQVGLDAAFVRAMEKHFPSGE